MNEDDYAEDSVGGCFFSDYRGIDSLVNTIANVCSNLSNDSNKNICCVSGMRRGKLECDGYIPFNVYKLFAIWQVSENLFSFASYNDFERTASCVEDAIEEARYSSVLRRFKTKCTRHFNIDEVKNITRLVLETLGKIHMFSEFSLDKDYLMKQCLELNNELVAKVEDMYKKDSGETSDVDKIEHDESKIMNSWLRKKINENRNNKQ